MRKPENLPLGQCSQGAFVEVRATGVGEGRETVLGQDKTANRRVEEEVESRSGSFKAKTKKLIGSIGVIEADLAVRVPVKILKLEQPHEKILAS